MKFGIATTVTDESLGPAALARAVEERGLASMFVSEHTHVPVRRVSPYPGGELPRDAYRLFDPVVALTAAATATQRLVLGTAVALIPQRDPILFAKEWASLDLVSGGRTVLGIGHGWNREETANHGTDPRTRMALMRERVLAMREIWTKEEAEFHGDHVDFDPIFSWPKPVRVPPVLVGGWGPTTLDRVLDYGDGWMPIVGRGFDGLAEAVAELRERAGRRVPVTAYGASSRPEVVESLAAADVDEVLFMLRAGSEADTMRRLDRMETTIAGRV